MTAPDDPTTPSESTSSKGPIVFVVVLVATLVVAGYLTQRSAPPAASPSETPTRPSAAHVEAAQHALVQGALSATLELFEAGELVGGTADDEPLYDENDPLAAKLRKIILDRKVLAQLEGSAKGRVRLVSDAEFDRLRLAWFERHFDAERLIAEGYALKALGLFPVVREYPRALQRLQVEEVEIYYDEIEKQVIARERLSTDPNLSMMLAQNLTLHAQDELYSWTGLLAVGQPRPDDDFLLARTAFLQGIAAAVGLEVRTGRASFLFDPASLALLDRIEVSTLEERPEDDPYAFLIRLDLFSLQGTRYLLHHFQAGTGLHALHQQPPRTTAELMQPERDPATDPPLRISVDGLPVRALTLPASTKPAYENVLGAFGLSVWLELVGAMPRDEARALVAAWDGDRLYTLPMDESGKYVYIVHVSVWEDEPAAKAFAEAAAKLFDRRYGPKAWRESKILQDGNRVVWLEGTYPSKERAERFVQDTLGALVVEPLPPFQE